MQKNIKVLEEKWNAILETDKLPKIDDPVRRKVTAQLLENEEKYLKEDAVTTASLPGGGSPGLNWDPILIGMVRRIAPRLIAYDVCGVQPMTAPTGLIFALKARYNNATGPEALGANEPDASFSGDTANTPDTSNPFLAAFDDTDIGGMTTSAAENATTWNAMSVTLERTSVEAKSRQLRADWSIELSQDLKAVHGLDAEQELSNILSTEITAEINREIIRKIYSIAKIGAQYAHTPGTFALNGSNVDSDGRWSVEKYKTLMFAVEREANIIAMESRRGKGNILIASANVASALVLAGILDYAPALQAMTNLEVDVTGVTYAGNIGRFRVYVDPYVSHDGFVVGYKGATQYDAGMFYCPYVPLQMVRAINSQNFSAAVGFKSRYGLVANPFTTLNKNQNVYYRKVAVVGL